MTPGIPALLASTLPFKNFQIDKTLALLGDGATIPFISRYRKEATGGLDEVQIELIQQEFKRLSELQSRKETILDAIEKQGALSAELKKQIEETWSSAELEDLYLPYKQKRKTRATKAKELGLEPLAAMLMKQQFREVNRMAARFVTAEVADEAEALAGARDIIAEWINESPVARQRLRTLFQQEAEIYAKVVKAKAEEAQNYRDYFDFSEPLKYAKSHRVLAIFRAEAEGFLRVTISPSAEKALEKLDRIFLKANNEAADQVATAILDSWKRLLQPSLETEFKTAAKQKADTEAIAVFAENLRQLLLLPPLGAVRVLALDPGFRTGCKLVCLDAHGALKYNETIYPHPPQNEKLQASTKLQNYIEAYKIEAIAIGNGTAGRETFDFVKGIPYLPKNLKVFIVNEAGASVYSASKAARKEFPTFDVTVRGAVSIGRRLIDPLAELVKIDPKSIGVGQYQHDVDQKQLADSLGRVVENCVNAVGVNVNTASEHLLSYVSGIGPKLAESIVAHRTKNGAFTSRQKLLQVAGLGPKAFEQCAGFLRIPGAENPLDNSAVHPERYALVKQMAKDASCSLHELIGHEKALNQIDLKKYVTENVGLPTLNDIFSELKKPGRDPRGSAQTFQFSSEVRSIADLKVGMILPGLVTNITNFGAFVDVGAKQDGLVHISHLANRFVKDPNEVVKLNQAVRVKVLEIDAARKRIAFSIKEAK
jgi:uncharacterized protein